MFDPEATDEATACYHEAGHAWMAHLLGGHVTLCTIEDEDGSCMGKTTITWRGIGGRELARGHEAGVDRSQRHGDLREHLPLAGAVHADREGDREDTASVVRCLDEPGFVT